MKLIARNHGRGQFTMRADIRSCDGQGDGSLTQVTGHRSQVTKRESGPRRPDQAISAMQNDTPDREKENQLTKPRTSNAMDILIPFGVAAVYSVIVGLPVVSAIAPTLSRSFRAVSPVHSLPECC